MDLYLSIPGRRVFYSAGYAVHHSAGRDGRDSECARSGDAGGREFLSLAATNRRLKRKGLKGEPANADHHFVAVPGRCAARQMELGVAFGEGGAVFHAVLHAVERFGLDLADALAGEAELLA